MQDELEIRNLAARLAHLADEEPDMSTYIEHFTEDARWRMNEVEFSGRSEILAGALGRRRSGTQGPGTDTRHVITTHAVGLDGDTATGLIYLLFMSGTSTAPQVQSMARYADRYRRTPAGWLLAERSITVG
jgi:3-phenylpropionate/cinnamic acid dioxygenase small subunit